jgi:hypothetical protein
MCGGSLTPASGSCWCGRGEHPEIVQSEITPYVPMLSGERINKLIEKWKP